jgi:hypothetical protein
MPPKRKGGKVKHPEPKRAKTPPQPDNATQQEPTSTPPAADNAAEDDSSPPRPNDRSSNAGDGKGATPETSDIESEQSKLNLDFKGHFARLETEKRVAEGARERAETAAARADEAAARAEKAAERAERAAKSGGRAGQGDERPRSRGASPLSEVEDDILDELEQDAMSKGFTPASKKNDITGSSEQRSEQVDVAATAEGSAPATQATSAAPVTGATTKKSKRKKDSDVRHDDEDLYEFYLNESKANAGVNIPDRLNINDYLQIRTTTDRGRIVTTRQPIPAGTLLLQESALLPDIQALGTFANAKTNRKEAIPKYQLERYSTALRRQVSALSKTKKRQFLSLCYADEDNEEGRVQSNSFKLSKRSEQDLWFYISMINHSCVPNAYVSQYNDEVAYSLRAIADMGLDEEVNINYAPDWELADNRKYRRCPKPQADRLAQIKAQWGFDCACMACKDPATTDADYRKMHALEAAVRLDPYFEDPEDKSGSESEDSGKSSKRIGKGKGSVKNGKAPSKAPQVSDDVVFDVNDNVSRDKYTDRLNKLVKLFRKYHLIESLYTVTKQAANAFAEASEDLQDDDMVRMWHLRWQREAMDAGISLHGLETLANKGADNGIFRGGKNPESTFVHKMAQEIPTTMHKKFTTSVEPPTQEAEEEVRPRTGSRQSGRLSQLKQGASASKTADIEQNGDRNDQDGDDDGPDDVLE